ncbi:MAG: alanine racemase, partial [Sphingomonas sp.]
YNAAWTATTPTDVAIINLGYADGYGRAFSDKGTACHGARALPVIGRVSMDLVAVDATGLALRDGDWLEIRFALLDASAVSGMSQYELLTRLGGRYERRWSG